MNSQAQTAKRLLAALQERQDLTRVALHELKNFVGSLHGYLQLLESTLPETAEDDAGAARVARLKSGIQSAVESIETISDSYLNAANNDALVEALATGGERLTAPEALEPVVAASAAEGGAWRFSEEAKSSKATLPWKALRTGLGSYIYELRSAGSVEIVAVDVETGEDGLRRLSLTLPELPAATGIERSRAYVDMPHAERMKQQGQLFADNLIESLTLALGGDWQEGGPLESGFGARADRTRCFRIPERIDH